MNLFVTGAGGFLGRALVKQLLAAGHQVRATVRRGSAVPNWSGNPDVVRCDIRDKEVVKRALIGIDAVIHLAAATRGSEQYQFATTVVGTERLLEAMVESSVKRIIHISSIAVYDWHAIEGTLNELTPLLGHEVYKMGGYATAKLWQERIIEQYEEQHELSVTIIRPGFIWGRDQLEIAGMGRRFGRVHFMFGPLSRLPLTHVLNCADAIVAATESPNSIGKRYNLVDDDAMRVWKYALRYYRGRRKKQFLIPIPYRMGLWTAKLAGLTSSLLFGTRGRLPSLLTARRYEAQFKPVRFDSTRIKSDLGWNPPLTPDECFLEAHGRLR